MEMENFTNAASIRSILDTAEHPATDLVIAGQMLKTGLRMS